MAYYGLNFRASSGYVTDGSGETYVIDTDSGSFTRGGISMTLGGTSISGNGRDRIAIIDRRLAGLVFQANGGAVTTLAITLPDGPGTYNVWVALGDDSSQHTNQKLVIKDNTTTKLTITGNMSAASRWFDANGVERNSSTWPTFAKGGASEASGAASVAFSSSSMVLEWGNTTGTSLTVLAHVGWEFVSGGGGSAIGAAPIARSFAVQRASNY